MIYLASPYSHPNVFVRNFRYSKALEYTASRMLVGEPIFSPIVYGHPFANFGVGTDYRTWRRLDEAILAECDEFRIYKLPGWEDSVGIAAETEYVRKNTHARITYVEHV